MSFGVHPVILVAIIGILLAIVALIIAFKARTPAGTIFMMMLAILFLLPIGYVFLVFHPELVDARFRTYKHFYNDIQIGMTRAEVLAALDRRYPKTGARLAPKVMEDETNHLGFFMNPETSREPNCEGIFLVLTNGRVASKIYSAD